ncbi:MAG: hypothetical protein HZC42_08650 [Candidatus Eisenbacteria bacterium]|nr:hypothetical protein [Candidatus Eisenbacteria bacterium]
MRRGSVILAAAGVLILLGPEGAGARVDCPPSPSASTAPAAILVVGRHLGEPDPAGMFAVTVRELAGSPVPGSMVVVDFSGCDDLRLCQEQAPGEIVDCASHTVRGFTGADGVARFVITGAARNLRGGAGAGAGCARIYADGVMLGSATVAVPDENGAVAAPGVEVTDMVSFLADLAGGAYLGRSDFDGDGIVDVRDLSTLLRMLGTGASSESCRSSGLCP